MRKFLNVNLEFIEKKRCNSDIQKSQYKMIQKIRHRLDNCYYATVLHDQAAIFESVFFFQISPLGYHHPVWMSSVNDKICIYAEIIFSSTHASPDQIAVHNQYTTRIFTTLFLTSYHEQCPVFFMSFLVCFFFFDSVCVLFFLFLRKVSIGHQLKISKLLIYFRVHTIL